MSEHLTASDLNSLKAKIAVSNLIGEEDVVAKLLSAYESLQAVVAALPKCWRLNDAGERVQDVPVVPGMKVFYRHAVRGTIYSDVIADLVPYSTDPESSIWAGGEIGVDQCASTEAAARAAGEEGSDDVTT